MGFHPEGKGSRAAATPPGDAKQRKAKTRRARREGSRDEELELSIDEGRPQGPSHGLRVAVFGGNAGLTKQQCEHKEEVRGAASVKYYESIGEGGGGNYKALLNSIKRGGVDRVFFITRFNGHAPCSKIRATCKTHDVPCGWFDQDHYRSNDGG